MEQGKEIKTQDHDHTVTPTILQVLNPAVCLI